MLGNKRTKSVLIFLIPILITGWTVRLFFREAFQPPVVQKTKYILYWTKMFGRKDFNFGLGDEIFKNCPKSNCFATYDKKLMPVQEFDAVLFHGAEYDEKKYGKPEDRSPHQVYIYSNQESPAYTPVVSKFVEFFNWTMTYRQDSDITRPYGVILKENNDYTPPAISEIGARPRKVAWMVSNCETFSLRHILFDKISRLMSVDVFGKCGNMSCSKTEQDDCYDALEKHYKFYFSFENSVCRDYVTEKLFNVLKKNLVPVVYGGGDYAVVSPPHSVINVDEFGTVGDLVDYLNYLDDNPEEYVKFFEWKKSYSVVTTSDYTLCQLCEKLNQPLIVNSKVYNDMEAWWRYPGVCKNLAQLPKLLFN